MLAWLPTYFTDTLDLNLSQAAQARCCLSQRRSTPGKLQCAMFIISTHPLVIPVHLNLPDMLVSMSSVEINARRSALSVQIGR